jgi:hypothetical protein
MVMCKYLLLLYLKFVAARGEPVKMDVIGEDGDGRYECSSGMNQPEFGTSDPG